MRIIKEGKPPKEKLLTATCRNCKTEIEFAMKEASYISDQRDGDFVSINCPICVKIITKSI